MAEKTIDTTGLEEFLKLMGKTKNLNDKFYWPIHDAFEKAGTLLEEQIKQNLTDNDSVGTGHLRSAITHGITLTNQAIVEEVGAGALPYAAFLEYGAGPAIGRKAFTPPISITEPGQPLFEWVKKKHLVGAYSLKKGHRRLGSKQKQISEDKTMALMVWNSIRKHGLKPHPYFFTALEQKHDEIMKLFDVATDELLKQLKGNNTELHSVPKGSLTLTL